MFDSLSLLGQGLSMALQPENLLFALIGCLLGTLVGVLPGIGPTATTAMLIPIAAGFNPVAAIIMLCAIYYGAQYGGTITSVLLNTPGEVSSAVTCLDGHQMAKRGRAATALASAAIGSFIGGTIASLGLVFLAIPLSSIALKFGPAEFFALVLFGLTLVVGLAGRSLKLAFISAIVGALIAAIGIDPVVGEPRFTFGSTELLNGIEFVPVLMGLFGLSEILLNLTGRDNTDVAIQKTGRPEWRAIAKTGPAVARGTGIGFLLGLVPGVGAAVPTFMSYGLERRMSKKPGDFGKGAIEGVAGPETANNAYANSSLIPLFTLGIPASATLAVLTGAFLQNGLTPGPLLFAEHGELAWAIIASFFVGNVILLVLNLPLIPAWAAILKIPYSLLYGLIIVFAVVGAYALRANVFDVVVMIAFGFIGYAFKRLDVPLAPLCLTLILAPMVEKALRQSLSVSQGDPSILVSSPISIVLLCLSVVAVAAFATRAVRAEHRVTVDE
ncbi:tripartite tricarboxylate transporter permease [Saccharopolyspora sp. ASAGF58]|uniref:tripartite tricarboxylate transporter permease n=1 Tax=Saccharopolyspora sp. ASAGF58 TaxID=2719023 RepID=UPI00143FE8D4|nr:tripartite tricarboxylate transporter permease [Saccharopolyspora sp. ASAGF58]QIZ38607.1 tripartite tricarboxylate transporter permease [Saccharopolyspora sp. ASAGF58]